MPQVGTGAYTYELIRDWPKMPKGESLGVVSRVATDSQDRVYVFQRKDPPIVVFDREGNYLGSWGNGAVKDAHGLKIIDDICYTTDRPDSVCISFTLDGRPLTILGKRGVHADTGTVTSVDVGPMSVAASGELLHPATTAVKERTAASARGLGGANLDSTGTSPRVATQGGVAVVSPG